MRPGPQVIYLADARMPTEKAHGWQIVKMCEAFAAAGAEVELWTPRRHPEEERAARLGLFDYYGVPQTFRHRILSNVDIVAMEPRMPPGLVRPVIQGYSTGWELLAAARARRAHPALVYTRDLAAAFWSASLRAPTALEVHALPGVNGERVLRRLASARSREPRCIVALTPAIRDAYARAGFSEPRLIVEGDAVDPADYAGMPSKARARKALALPLDRPIAGYVGRFHTLGQEKGLPGLVASMALVEAADGREPLLVCIGGPMDRVPGYRDAARRAGVDPDRLRFVDRVPNPEVPGWLRALDVAVMPYPSTPHYAYAASPLKMFEYMAARTPIVATDLPSTRLVLSHERNALLVPPGDEAAMGAAIGRLFSDGRLAARLARRAASDVAPITWENRARRILAAAGVAP